jgi:hypothetical protein
VRSGKNNSNYRHGLCYTSSYHVWQEMVQRCTYDKHKRYKDYGGRGITVCKRWLKFTNFFKDVGHRPEGLSLDRIDNNKGYCKKNCRWTTLNVQSHNIRKRPNCVSKYFGVYKNERDKFRAFITFNKKRIFLGDYDSPKDAAQCYDLASLLYFKDRSFKNKQLGAY